MTRTALQEVLQTEDQPEYLSPPINEVEQVLHELASVPKLPSFLKSRNVREQFQHAFELIGGIPRLAHWAHSDPKAFYQLYSKLIPAQVTGADGGAIKVELSWLNARDTSGNGARSAPQIIDVDPSK